MKNHIVKRNGEVLPDDQTGSMRFLYSHAFGRFLLRPLIGPTVSKIAGGFLNTRFSTFLIPSFIKNNKIDMNEYKPTKYSCYNEFFTREIKEACRPIDHIADHLISPCDSKVTYYRIDEHTGFKIKDSLYSVDDLLQNKELAQQYQNGVALIFRLSVDDYHRYCFIDEGKYLFDYRIKGKLHTVNPIASYHYKIYKTNSRHVNVLETVHFDQVIAMEVGAMMVGKIKNQPVETFKRGMIKGWFEFGGSTVVLLFKENTVEIDQDIIDFSTQDIEVKVKMGEKIGVAIRKEETYGKDHIHH